MQELILSRSLIAWFATIAVLLVRGLFFGNIRIKGSFFIAMRHLCGC